MQLSTHTVARVCSGLESSAESSYSKDTTGLHGQAEAPVSQATCPGPGPLTGAVYKRQKRKLTVLARNVGLPNDAGCRHLSTSLTLATTRCSAAFASFAGCSVHTDLEPCTMQLQERWPWDRPWGHSLRDVSSRGSANSGLQSLRRPAGS